MVEQTLVEPEFPETDPAYQEIRRLWTAFRSTELNVRYYGFLAQKQEQRSKHLQIAITVLSSAATVVFAAKELRDILIIPATIAAGLAAILAASMPYLALESTGKAFSHLNASYKMLSSQMMEALMAMRRQGLTPELLGRSKQLLDSMSRLQGLDVPEYGERSAGDQVYFQAEVDEAFPVDYLWTNI